MTGQIPSYEGGSPEIDPIKDVFIEDGLRELLGAVDYGGSAAGIVDLVSRGILSTEDVALMREQRAMPPESNQMTFNEALDIVVNVSSNQDTSTERYYDAYFEYASATGGKEDFVPMEYLLDGGRNKSGISLEEWRELPESTRDTLRDERF